MHGRQLPRGVNNVSRWPAFEAHKRNAFKAVVTYVATSHAAFISAPESDEIASYSHSRRLFASGFVYACVIALC